MDLIRYHSVGLTVQGMIVLLLTLAAVHEATGEDLELVKATMESFIQEGDSSITITTRYVFLKRGESPNHLLFKIVPTPNSVIDGVQVRIQDRYVQTDVAPKKNLVSGSIDVPGHTTEDTLQVSIQYLVHGSISHAEYAFTAYLPVAWIQGYPKHLERDLFQASISLPASLKISNAFPAHFKLIEKGNTHYEFRSELPVAPTYIRLQGYTNPLAGGNALESLREAVFSNLPDYSNRRHLFDSKGSKTRCITKHTSPSCHAHSGFRFLGSVYYYRPYHYGLWHLDGFTRPPQFLRRVFRAATTLEHHNRSRQVYDHSPVLQPLR